MVLILGASNVMTLVDEASPRCLEKLFPFVGGSIIWAMTALDVMDACDTLKDLNGLAIAAGDDTIASESTVCGLRVPTTD